MGQDADHEANILILLATILCTLAVSFLLYALKKRQARVLSNGSPTAPEMRAKQINVKKMNDMVYLVHKPPADETPQLELVFFHGLELKCSEQAHVKTWMSRDDSQFWPKTWLAESFPNSRILTVCYDSRALDMFRTAENLLSLLDELRVGKAGCPVVFVGHCLGGLILKELCIFAYREQLGRQRVQDLFSNLKGMFFYGTPQSGSALGDMLHHLFKGEGAPIEEIETLKASSARRNEQFNSLKSHHNWVTFGIGETRETYLPTLGKHVLVSPEASTRPYMDQYYSIVDADHYDICKPKNNLNDSAFLKLEQFLKEIQKGGVRGARKKADLVSGREFVIDHEGRAKKLEGLLSKPDIHTVFVVGLSGVGKTTVAQQVFHNLSNCYEVLCFVSLDAKPGDVSDQVLKEQTVTRIVGQLGEVNKGFEQSRSSMIYLLKGRKVLMVLDNVESEVQLKALSTEEWLEGSSSKLIVTTNSPSVIRWIATSAVFEVKYLSKSESKELFDHHAFKGQDGPDDLKEVIQQVIDQCEHHPLSLKVLGAYIGSMEEGLQEDLLMDFVRKLQRAEELDSETGHDRRIWGKLKVCYDVLPPSDKEMFLDIATFFHGWQLSFVERIWRGSLDSPTLISWRNLKKRFLVSTRYDSTGSYSEGDCIQMHQLLRNLGQSIACPSDTSIDKWTRIPEALSRWEEIEEVTENVGRMETFAVNVKPMENMMLAEMLKEKSFSKCYRLKYLVLDGVGATPERLELPRSLVYLRLKHGSFNACPVDFTRLRKLVVLELVHCASMELLPNGLVNVKELTWLELEGCLKLRELPSGLSEKLEYLGLEGTRLEKLPEDLGRFKQLCRLKVHSPQLTGVPESIGHMKSLSKLDLSYTNVSSLPESIGGLKTLKEFCMSHTILSSLPNSICELRDLRKLTLQNTCLKGLPPSMGDLGRLQDLSLEESPLETLPHSIGKLCSLQTLNLRTTQIRTLPGTIGNLELIWLSLWNTPLESLPDSVGGLRNLLTLELGNTNLQCLPESTGDLGQLMALSLHNTPLQTLPHSIGKLRSLQRLDLRATLIRTLPETIGDLNDQLNELRISSTKWMAWPESFAKLHLLYLEAPISSFWGTHGAASESEEVEGKIEPCRPSNLTLKQEESEGEGTRASSWSEEIEGQQEESSPLPIEETSQFKMNSHAFHQMEELKLNGRCCPDSWLLPLFRTMQQKSSALILLTLEDFILAEEIPCEIGKLTSLQILVVTGWSRLRELPESLGELSALGELVLRDNRELYQLPECLPFLPNLYELSIFQCESLQSMPRSSRREPPLDKAFDSPDPFLRVRSDSWTVLESFFTCCGKRVASHLCYEYSEVDEARENAALRSSGFREGLVRLDNKVFMERFNEECLHHRWDYGDRSVDDGSGPSTSVCFHSYPELCTVRCGLHNYRKTLVLTLTSTLPKPNGAEYSLSQNVLDNLNELS